MWRVLLVYLAPHPRALRLTIRQHLEALERLPNAEWVLPYNAVHGIPSWLGKLDFDAVVLHTTFLCMRWSIWFEPWKRRNAWLADLDALKVALPQDEYNNAETLDSWLDELGVSVVGTVLDDAHRDELYPRLAKRAAFYELLTGYIDDDMARRVAPRLRPPAEREFDIVYRARNLPYWLGSHGQLKHRIGEAVAERAPALGLRCDISTRPQQTVLGDAWLDFMATGRATIGAESGSSALDLDGEKAEQLSDLLAENPDLTFEEYASRMPPGWDDYRFFAPSPRHLEAVVTKTAQILVEGHYGGVLEAGRHYLPVRRDFSNLEEVLETARDTALLEQLAERAYGEVFESGRYSSRRLGEALGRMLREHAAPHTRRRRIPARKIVEAVTAAESVVERTVAAPVANVIRVGSDGHGQMAAGLRLLLTDSRIRRLILDYVRSTETRNHVSPRQALVDLMTLAAMSRAARGNGASVAFAVSADVDRERQRLVLRSRPVGSPGPDGTPTTAELAALLDGGGWEFAVDHSEVGASLEFPLLGSRSIELPLRGGHTTLGVLNWLARYQPRDVAYALSPVLR